MKAKFIFDVKKNVLTDWLLLLLESKEQFRNSVLYYKLVNVFGGLLSKFNENAFGIQNQH